MFIDASALVAILLDEPERERFSDAVANSSRPVTSPVAVYETTVALMRVTTLTLDQATIRVRRALQSAGIEVVPISDEIGRAALDAFDRFGKGRHKAGLNMGDCFAYGAARVLGVPLLYKGADFAETELG